MNRTGFDEYELRVHRHREGTDTDRNWNRREVVCETLRDVGITRRQALAESLLTIAGVEPDTITIVINTHLHFDHAGGNTALNGDGEAVPAFPNARYFYFQK